MIEEVKWGAILSLSLVVVLMILYDWARLKASTRRMRMTFYVLTFSGWGSAILLIHFPSMPGPSELWLFLYQPLTDLLHLH